MNNALMVIFPYKHQGMWVFDDDAVGLVREPFVAGADTWIDLAVEAFGIENADEGFRLLFSAGPVPDYHIKLNWLREGDGGNWYQAEPFDVEGWLCPALLKYFDKAPEEIYGCFLPSAVALAAER